MSNEKAWYKRWWAVASLAALVIVILASLGGGSGEPSPAPVAKEEVAAVFDLEALYGKDIAGIRAALGEPADGKYADPTPQQLALGAKQWDNTFRRGEHELLVTYDISSGEVVDFFIGADDPSGATGDTERLEKMLNVYGSARFTVEPVRALKNPSVYTGIKAVPKR